MSNDAVFVLFNIKEFHKMAAFVQIMEVVALMTATEYSGSEL
jgi:hypothetical protein